jgi:hypothetical protein
MVEHNLELQFRMDDIGDNNTFDRKCAEADEDVQIESRKQDDNYAK